MPSGVCSDAWYSMTLYWMAFFILTVVVTIVRWSVICVYVCV